MLILNTINRSIYISCRCASIFNKSSTITLRNYSDEKSEKIFNAMKELEENFDPIYRFPKIRLAAASSKLKNFQGIVTTIGLPISYFVVPEHFGIIAYTGFAFLAALCVSSAIMQNSIGAVYVHKKNPEIIRIAFIDFWGFRRDSEFKVEEILPLYESKSKLSLFSPVKFTNYKSLKFISTANVTVIDSGEFSRIFGDE